MKEVYVKITSCRACPHFKIGDKYSSDGWDRMGDWVCEVDKKIIQGGVEWYEESKIEIPDWCPLKKNNKYGKN